MIPPTRIRAALPLVALCIIAGSLRGAESARHPDAIPIFHCPFDAQWDQNYDEWPDLWTRERSAGYHLYVPIEIVADETAVAGRCLEVRMNGGDAAVYSPPIRADARFSYVLECRVRTEGLKRSRAFVSVTFYDGQQNALETVASEQLSGETGWKSLHVGPFSPKSEDAETAVVGLHVEAGERADLSGLARFDDVWLARLPRMNLRTNRPHNVYTDPADVVVSCRLSGIIERDPEIRFELLDASGGSIARDAQKLEGEIIAEKSSKASELLGGAGQPAGYAGSAEWKPPLKEFGFYRVRVQMRSPKGIMHQRDVTLAVIRPLGQPVRGEFGWSLPDGDRPLSLDALTGLLPHVGINWLKFPVWYGQDNPARGDQLMRFTERLAAERIEMVGLLDKPPAQAEDSLGEGDTLSAAHIFSSDPTFWFPSLDPVMTRLSLRIRWWQLGGDHDTSFVGFPNLPKKIEEIKNQLYRFGQEVHIGIGWQWLAETIAVENPPWEFMTLSANPPLTGDEMAVYLGPKEPRRTLRWVLVEPLARRHYPLRIRARDLVEQMMAAKIHDADGIFLPRPISTEWGLMNDDGTPGELLLPWRTTALVLGGSNYLGSIRMPGGSSNHIFARDGEAVMIVWNEQPTEEVIYLGDDVQQIDIWGRMARPGQRDGRQIIQVGVLPTFLTGTNEQVARWRMAVRFEETQLPSVFGVTHRNAVQMKNFFPQGAGGQITLNTPEVWKTFPRTMLFKAAAGEEVARPFEIELRFTASSGKQDVRLDFEVNADRRYQFSVYRELEVGLGDVEIEVATKLQENGLLVVEQRMTNHTDNRVDFKCMLYAPARRRQSNQVFRLGRGQDVKRYVLSDGAALVGQTLWLRAEEVGGARILNYRFVVEQ